MDAIALTEGHVKLLFVKTENCIKTEYDQKKTNVFWLAASLPVRKLY